MLRVLDILMPIHAAPMARNELIVGIDAQPVVIGLLRLAVLVFPFMPAKAGELWGYLGQSASPAASWAQAEAPQGVGAQVRKPEGLFPRPAPTTP